MSGVETSFLTRPVRANQFFDYKGLDGVGIARLEAAVKSARDTLELADRLQTMRDVNRKLWKLENDLKNSSAHTHLSSRLLDFSV